MAQVDYMEPTQAFRLGVVLSAVNPKNLTLAIGAALVIRRPGSTRRGRSSRCWCSWSWLR